ncbi:uncharacterized protein LOC115385738 [Salarias fasciatus]|uniref:uncharacterized protein LOC115385738 n=1 Tax=Salarias fasciatus TaxID=181472 RepID=UPI001176EAF5|nr:uncharacterized protein LOC115385738 [Salarias fasciatus]
MPKVSDDDELDGLHFSQVDLVALDDFERNLPDSLNSWQLSPVTSVSSEEEEGERSDLEEPAAAEVKDEPETRPASADPTLGTSARQAGAERAAAASRVTSDRSADRVPNNLIQPYVRAVAIKSESNAAVGPLVARRVNKEGESDASVEEGLETQLTEEGQGETAINSIAESRVLQDHPGLSIVPQEAFPAAAAAAAVTAATSAATVL